MKTTSLALILVVGSLLCCACGSGDKTAETPPLTAAQMDAAKAQQSGAGGVKAKNGGGIVPVEDGPPPAGAKVGMPQTGGKASGN